MSDKFVKGEMIWIKTKDPEEFQGKKSWSVVVYPDKESLDMIREWQSEGVKNVLKKDDKGWYVKFSRPTQRVNRDAKVTKVFAPPVVVDSSGNVVDAMISNGATGTVKIDLYEHRAPGGGTAKAARLEGIKLDQYNIWGSDVPKVNTEVKQENYF